MGLPSVLLSFCVIAFLDVTFANAFQGKILRYPRQDVSLVDEFSHFERPGGMFAVIIVQIFMSRRGFDFTNMLASWNSASV